MHEQPPFTPRDEQMQSPYARFERIKRLGSFLGGLVVDGIVSSAAIGSPGAFARSHGWRGDNDCGGDDNDGDDGDDDRRQIDYDLVA